jgi:hypothetical protein
MHTDPTLDIFDKKTICIGAEFRAFNDKTCSAFETRELVREADTRECQTQRKAEKLKKSQVGNQAHTQSTPATADSTKEEQLKDRTSETTSYGPRRRPKKFNLQTYKYHCLGDYPAMIRRYGTSDSFSTEPVSDYHSLCLTYMLTVSPNVGRARTSHLQSTLQTHKQKMVR